MKKIIITSIYPNFHFEENFKIKWKNQFENYSKELDADYLDFESTQDSPFWESYETVISETFKGETVVKKKMQLKKLDYIDVAFSKGYDWVMWIDSDMAINPNPKFNSFKEAEESKIYFWDIKKTLPGRLRFEDSLKEDFLEKNELVYGNQGVLMIHKNQWNKIKKIILNEELVLQKCKKGKLYSFLSHIDQNIFSIAITILQLKIEHINRKDLFHFCGKQKTPIFKRKFNLTDEDLNSIKDNFKLQHKFSEPDDLSGLQITVASANHIAPTAPGGIPDFYLNWLPMLHYYLNSEDLNQAKEKLWLP